MVQTAEADVVGPAVAAEDPAALLVEEVLAGHDALVALAVTGTNHDKWHKLYGYFEISLSVSGLMNMIND